MGRPVWVLVPFAPDWRWALAGRDDALVSDRAAVPADALGDWDGVIARVGAELARFGTIA